ncbi:MAG: hypothetical protein VX069_09295 [Cyanobacteriota bacterium]|nr:hypothetical protein [Cyanobacteriota bacterium]
MSSLQRWLLVPCLAPLLGLLLTSALNNTGNTRLKLLIWRSPSLPIGAWTALAGLSGAGFSAISVLLLVQSNPPLRRQRHQPLERSRSETNMPEVAAAPPQRDVRDPAPTVAVPYRIVQKPRPRQQSTSSGAATPSRPSDPTTQSSEGWGVDPDLDW